jgi:hypothetical protein
MTDQQESRPFPQLSESLILELNKRFPECCADLEWSVKQVYFMSGQRAIVRFLNKIYNEQQETVL